MYKTGENELVICPYNRYHCVSKLRIQKHIMKCQKNYPDIKLATCFYNYSHRILPENLLDHYKVCPQKMKLEGARYNDLSDFSLEKSTPEEYYLCFQDLSVKTKFFGGKDKTLSNAQNSVSSGKATPSSFKFDNETSSLESLSDNNITDDDSDCKSDAELEPLPLPNTISKAFICIKQPTGDTADMKPKLFEEK